MKHYSTGQRRKEKFFHLGVVQFSLLSFIYNQFLNAHVSLPNRRPASTRIMLYHSPPPRYPCPNPQNQWTSLHMAKKDFAGVIKLRSLRGGDYPWSCRWAQGLTSILIRWRSEYRNRQFDDGSKRLSAGRKGSQAKECRWPPEAMKGNKMHSPLDSPEGTSPANIWTLTHQLLKMVK